MTGSNASPSSHWHWVTWGGEGDKELIALVLVDLLAVLVTRRDFFKVTMA